MNPALLPSVTRLKLASLALIERETAAAFGLRPEDLRHWGRESRYTWPRQVAMWLMRRLTGATLQEIAARFGKRDHGTVMNAERRVQAFMDSYPKLRRELLALEKTIENENRTAGETAMGGRPADMPEGESSRLCNGIGSPSVF